MSSIPAVPLALSQPLPSGLHSVVACPPPVLVQEEECHQQEQQDYRDHDDGHHLLVGHGLWGEKR